MKKILTVALLAMGSTACSQTSNLNKTLHTQGVVAPHAKTVVLDVQLVSIAKSELDTLPSDISDLITTLQAAPHSSQTMAVLLQQGSPSEVLNLRTESYVASHTETGSPIKKQAKDGYQFIFTPNIQPSYLYLKTEGKFDNIIDKASSPASNATLYHTEQHTLSTKARLEYDKATLMSSVTMADTQLFVLVTPTQR